jgi:hypothetical protein
MIASERLRLRRISWGSRSALALLALGPAVPPGLAGCAGGEDGCTLDTGPLVELHLRHIDGSPIASVVVRGTYAGVSLPDFGCGLEEIADTSLGDGCDDLWVPIQDPEVSSTLELTIEAAGYEPAQLAADVSSDGCHLVADQAFDVAIVATIATVCASWCSVDIACTPDVDWNMADCAAFCEADVTPAPDETDGCDQEYRDLYLCQGSLTCSAYLDDDDPTCAAYVTAIDACES